MSEEQVIVNATGIARLEADMTNVKEALERGSERFQGLENSHKEIQRTQADLQVQLVRGFADLRSLVTSTHEVCAKHEDMSKLETRISGAETWVTRYNAYLKAIAVGGGIAATLAGIIAAMAASWDGLHDALSYIKHRRD